MSFIDEHRECHGVEPICKELPIAPSTYFEQKARERDPDRRPDRVQQDQKLREEIVRVRHESFKIYGVREARRHPNREGIRVARCTVARLMQKMGLRGATRGRRFNTTIPDETALRPLDLVERDFSGTRPNQLWGLDLTYLSAWQGFVCVTFVIDVSARPSA